MDPLTILRMPMNLLAGLFFNQFQKKYIRPVYQISQAIYENGNVDSGKSLGEHTFLKIYSQKIRSHDRFRTTRIEISSNRSHKISSLKIVIRIERIDGAIAIFDSRDMTDIGAYKIVLPVPEFDSSAVYSVIKTYRATLSYIEWEDGFSERNLITPLYRMLNGDHYNSKFTEKWGQTWETSAIENCITQLKYQLNFALQPDRLSATGKRPYIFDTKRYRIARKLLAPVIRIDRVIAALFWILVITRKGEFGSDGQLKSIHVKRFIKKFKPYAFSS